MMQTVIRLSAAALLAVASSAAVAGDWPWREQVQLEPAATSKAVWVRVADEIPARDHAQWRELIPGYRLPLLVTVPVHASAAQTSLVWREQVTLPALGEQGAPLMRMSGGEFDAGTRRQ